MCGETKVCVLQQLVGSLELASCFFVTRLALHLWAFVDWDRTNIAHRVPVVIFHAS